MPSQRKADRSFSCLLSLRFGAADEVSKRIEFWKWSEFEVLLQRRDQQKLLKEKNRKRKRQPPSDDAVGKGNRARGTAAVGVLPEGHIAALSRR